MATEMMESCCDENATMQSPVDEAGTGSHVISHLQYRTVTAFDFGTSQMKRHFTSTVMTSERNEKTISLQWTSPIIPSQ